MNIGLIAHSKKKKLMQDLCIAYKDILCHNELFATGTTGRQIEEVTNLHIHKYLSGHLGGVQQMAAQISENCIDMVIYLRDPLTEGICDSGFGSILRLCDTYNIPLATNIASAELMILALGSGWLEWREAVRKQPEAKA